MWTAFRDKQSSLSISNFGSGKRKRPTRLLTNAGGLRTSGSNLWAPLDSPYSHDTAQTPTKTWMSWENHEECARTLVWDASAYQAVPQDPEANVPGTAWQLSDGCNEDDSTTQASQFDTVDAASAFTEWSELKPPRPRSAWSQRSADLLASVVVQSLIALVIIGNAVIIGLETDLPDLKFWDEIEDIFLAIFVFELALKLFTFGWNDFFSYRNPDFHWNAFDFLIVTLGMIDLGLGLVMGRRRHGGGVATVFRIIRLLRILRIFRIVKYLRQLYMLAFGLALAAVAVFWVTFLMIFVLYVCSIILVRTIGHVGEDDPDGEFLHSKFGSIARSMLTLFQLMSSPNLEEYGDILWRMPLFTVFMISFVIFGSFGMIALLTGVISESMFEKNNLKIEEDRQERENKRKLLVRTCGALYDGLPLNEEGEASRSDIVRLLSQLAEMFESQGIDFAHDDLHGMIEVIDADGSGTISREEFRHFIVQMAEGVRPLLIMELYYAVAMIKNKMDKQETMLESCEQRLKDVDWAQESGANHIVGMSNRLEQLGSTMEMLGSQMSLMNSNMVLISKDVAELKRWNKSDVMMGSSSSHNSYEPGKSPKLNGWINGPSWRRSPSTERVQHHNAKK